MTTELQKLMKKAREVQLTTDVVKEMAIPLQKLVDLTQEEKIKGFKFEIKNKNSSMFSNAAMYVSVNFDDSALPLKSLLGIDVPGLSEKETQKAVLGEKVYKQITPELRKELVEINDHISSINMFFGNQLQATDTLFYYSTVRVNNDDSFKEEGCPMFPDYLEDLIELHGTKKENKGSLKIK